MPPRKSNVSQISATGEDGTSIKEREGISIEVGLNALTPVFLSPTRYIHVLAGPMAQRSSHFTLFILGSSSPLHRTS